MTNYLRGTKLGSYVLTLTTALLMTTLSPAQTDDPTIDIGRYTVKKSQIPKLKILKGIADDDIWVGKSDKDPYILNFFTDTANMTYSSLIPVISKADNAPGDHILSDRELDSYFNEAIKAGLEDKHER